MSNAKDTLITDDMSQKIIETAECIALSTGAQTVTVRKILQTLGITNRVFYNRFHNIDEVLFAVYKNTVLKIRECITAKIDETKDFFEHVMDMVVKTLIL